MIARTAPRVAGGAAPLLFVFGGALRRRARRGVRAAGRPAPGAGRRRARGHRRRFLVTRAAARHQEVTAGGALAVDGAGAVPPGHHRRPGCAGGPAVRRARPRPRAVGVRRLRRGAGRAARATASCATSERVQTEVYPLATFAVGGMMLFAAANDLLVMFVALEVLSLPLYLISGLARRRRLLSQEAAVKYFLLGAFASAFFLYGLALVYGATGSVRLRAIRAAAVDRRQRRRSSCWARAADRRPAVQGQRRPVPHLDAGRLPGRADAGHRLHGGLHEGRRVRRHPAAALRGVRHRASGPGGR